MRPTWWTFATPWAICRRLAGLIPASAPRESLSRENVMNQRGFVMLHVLVIIAMILLEAPPCCCSRCLLRAYSPSKRSRRPSQEALLEGAQAADWSCLAKTNYGLAGSCGATAGEQASLDACVPSLYNGAVLSYALTGANPPCRLAVRLTGNL